MGAARVADLQPGAIDLPEDADDLLYSVSVLHGFYALYTAEL